MICIISYNFEQCASLNSSHLEIIKSCTSVVCIWKRTLIFLGSSPLCVYLQNKSTLNWHKAKSIVDTFQPLRPHQTNCPIIVNTCMYNDCSVYSFIGKNNVFNSCSLTWLRVWWKNCNLMSTALLVHVMTVLRKGFKQLRSMAQVNKGKGSPVVGSPNMLWTSDSGRPPREHPIRHSNYNYRLKGCLNLLPMKIAINVTLIFGMS